MPGFFYQRCLQLRTLVRVALAALLLGLAGSSPAAADTIVLKNGRRIVALAVVEEGDKVRYQTAAGDLTLPKSIVDHIEKGGAVEGKQIVGDMLRRARKHGIAAPNLRFAYAHLQAYEARRARGGLAK